jgi:hypothetical protein
MAEGIFGRPRMGAWACAAALSLAVPAVVLSQAAPAPQPGAQAPAPGPGRGGPGPGRGGRAGGPAQTGRAAAPVDLTGYWVSIVTEDWIERMAPDSPPSGVAGGGPGGFGRGGGAAPAPAAPAKPDPCRVYAAGGSLRVPGRLHITWADDNTLKVDMDAGTQTRLFRFNAPPASGPKTLQGHSVATWEVGGGGRGGFGGRGAAPAAPRWGSLKVVTTHMTGGYLLSSRNTYSENAVLTEHFTRHADFGVEYFTVTAIIEDGAGQPRITSSTFKKEPDGSKFAPTGCDIVR